MVHRGDAPFPVHPYVRRMTDIDAPHIDQTTAERLAHGFNRCFETFADDERVLADDVFCDLYPPLWRFQIQGRETFERQLRAIAAGRVESRILRVVPTATGFAMEQEEAQQRDATTEIARRLWLCEVRGGAITSVVGYCNGGWDADLRARHAAEAPMLRTWETPR
jgi:hypothetical protein